MLGEIVRLVRGTTYKSALLGQPGPVLLGLASIQRNGGFRTDSLKTYGGESKPNILLQPGDLFVSLKDVTQSADLLGAIARVPESVTAGRLTQDTVKLEFGDSDYPRDLVYWALRTPAFRSYCRKHATGTTNLGLARDDFLAFRLPQPDRYVLDLVELLEALERRIDLLRQTNATLEAIAQALFKSWFVDFDPVRAKAEGREPEGIDTATAALFPSEFEESEIGLIPNGWRWSTLGHVTAKRGGVIQTGPFGSQLHASDYQPVGVPVVMPQDLAGRRVSEDRIARVSENEADRLSRHRLKSGDIVFSRRGDVGRHAIVSGREVGWLCGTGCLLVRPAADESISTFISAALARPESLEWLVRHAVGATMPNLNTKILSALPLVWPRDEVVRAYEHLASPLDQRVSANLAQAQSLAQLRDALLPRLISGILRLESTEN
ncbi:MAG: restriction endonuclease subunit S [Lysobacteraceae bacterium]